MNEVLTHWPAQSINQHIKQSGNQSINQSVSQSLNHSLTQSINQSINQLINQSNSQTSPAHWHCKEFCILTSLKRSDKASLTKNFDQRSVSNVSIESVTLPHKRGKAYGVTKDSSVQHIVDTFKRCSVSFDNVGKVQVQTTVTQTETNTVFVFEYEPFLCCWCNFIPRKVWRTG